MYQRFDLINVSTNLLEKKVTLVFSLDVDEASAINNTIVLCEKLMGTIASYSISVEGKTVILLLKDWPVPNTEYYISISNSLLSITEDSLDSSFRRTVVFPSEITSLIEITSPSNYEEISSVLLKWKEVLGESNVLVNNYCLEISTENVFYNLVIKTDVLNKQEINLENIADGQYFARIRAQNSSQYGKWSDVITFVVKAVKVVPVNVEYEQDLIVESSPENGVTPSSFIIEFDEDIDPAYEITVVVTRRRI